MQCNTLAWDGVRRAGVPLVTAIHRPRRHRSRTTACLLSRKKQDRPFVVVKVGVVTAKRQQSGNVCSLCAHPLGCLLPGACDVLVLVAVLILILIPILADDSQIVHRLLSIGAGAPALL